MDSACQAMSIVIFLLLLAVEVIFYGFGAALQNLNATQIRELAEEKKDKRAIRIIKIADSPLRYINTVQLIVTCIQLFIGGYFVRLLEGKLVTYAERYFEQFSVAIGVISILLSGLLFLMIILVFGVLIPKRLGSIAPEKWLNAFIMPIAVITTALSPFTSLLNLIASGILYCIGVRSKEGEGDVTEEEILSMVNEGHEQGVLQASEAEMITNIFEFSDKEARDIMTHRTNMVCIDGNMNLKEAVDFMLAEANSRYPVYLDNLDHIIGIIHLKDACRQLEMGMDNGKPIKTMRSLMREASYIPGTRKIDVLFRNMQSFKTHVVIVIDEYGQTDGLITMEDILEEIVGNIFDEYDDEEAFIEAKGNNQYEIDGLTPLDELGEELGIDFSKEEYETLNGLMIAYLEKIPDEGDLFDMDYDGYNFKVLAVENKMIKRVLVSKIQEKQKGEI